MSPPRARAAVLLATLLGLVLRLGVALLDPIPPVKDAAEYHGLATRLARGQGYVLEDGTATAFRPPGWPALLALVYRALGEDPVLGRVAQALVAALLVPLVGRLAWHAFGPGAAAVASLIAALYPGFVASWYGPRALLLEPLLTTLVFAALALAVEARAVQPGGGDAAPPPEDARPRRVAVLLFAAGVVAGLAALTRGTVLFLPALLALHAARSSRGSTLERARAGAAPLLGALLVVAPWALRNRLRLGEAVPVSTNGGISLWASYNPLSRGLGNAEEGYTRALAEDDQLRRAGTSEPERSRHFARKARAEIAARPLRALKLVLRKALLWVDPTYEDWTRPAPRRVYNWGYGALLPLALAGLLGTARAPDPSGARTLAVAFALILTVLHVAVHADPRYRISAEPVLAVLAAPALVRAHARLGPRRLVLAGLAYAGLQVALARGYAHVFALLSRLVRGMGLG